MEAKTNEEFFNVSALIDERFGKEGTASRAEAEEKAYAFYTGDVYKRQNSIPRPVRIGVHTGYDYDYNVQTSTRYLEDASYFKLKTDTLGYTLPESITKKIHVNSLRFYAVSYTHLDVYKRQVLFTCFVL